MMTTVSVYAQQPSMQALIGQSLSKLQQPTPEALLNCVAEMKRIDAMFPDSIQPKYQMALQSLYFSVMNPHAPQTDNLLAEAAPYAVSSTWCASCRIRHKTVSATIST